MPEKLLSHKAASSATALAVAFYVPSWAMGEAFNIEKLTY